MDDETLDRLRQTTSGPRRVLIAGGTVLSMDPAVGDFDTGDVLIEGSTISEVGPHLPDRVVPDDVVVVDATGSIVLPGFQDTHRHCWQTQLRRMFAGVDFEQYLQAAHRDLAPVYEPEDTYAATLLAAIGAIDSGITTMLDFSHNTRAAEFADASLQGLHESHIRAVYASGPALSGTWHREWPGDVARLRDEPVLRSDLLTLRLAVFGEPALGGPEILLTPENLAFARDHGLAITVDATFGPAASRNIEALGRAGLLGPDVTLIHCTHLGAEAWRAIADSGVRVSLTTTSDAQIGTYGGLPPIQAALDHGVRPGLSIDVECTVSSDMFVQMQGTYTLQRLAAFTREHDGDPDAPEPISPRRVLEMATVDGAAVNGLADVTGALAPGKAADLVLLSAETVNTMPLNNATGTVVLGADTANVDTVFVGGQVRKWRGKLVGYDLALLSSLVHASRDRLVAKSGYRMDVLR